MITGISSALGKLLTKKLMHTERVVGIARKPFHGKPKGIKVYYTDLWKRKCEDLFRTQGIKAVVHLGLIKNPRIDVRKRHRDNVSGIHALFDYAVKYRTSKVIIMSSAHVYGPQSDNPVFIRESASLNASRALPEMRDFIEVDMYSQSIFWKNPEINTVILRPVNVLGPTVRNAAANYLRKKTVPVLLGFDPMIQCIHEEDLVDAVIKVLKTDVKGIFNLTGPGELPLSAILKELDSARIPIPPYVAKGIFGFMWSTGLSSFPQQEIDFLKYHCIVDGSLAQKVLKLKPQYTLKETIQSLLD